MNRLFIAVMISFVFTAGAGASVMPPYPDSCQVEPWDTYDVAFVCPGLDEDSLTVFVADAAGDPIPDLLVEIEVASCSGLAIDCPGGLYAYTDSFGIAFLDPRIGGCDDCSVFIHAGGVLIRTYNKIVSPDWNGIEADGIVHLDDMSYFNQVYQIGPYDACADYNGDGNVDEQDELIFLDCFGKQNDYPGGYADCELSPPCLDFGVVDIGNYEEQSFEIINNGSGTLSGTVSESCDHYSIELGGGSYSLNNGESHMVVVRFTPTTVDTHICDIETGDATCLDLFCTGIGVEAPECLVVPDYIDFDTVFVGDTRDETFTIYNTGGGVLSGSASEFCDGFSVLDDYSYLITGGDSLEITVRFEPGWTNTFICMVHAGDPYCSDVTCEGYGDIPPVCEVVPSSLDFDSIFAGETKDMLFTITNTGGSQLTGSVSETCDHYSIISGGGPYTLGGGEFVDVTVRFAPADTGVHHCTIETGDALCTDVSCDGYGKNPAACLVEPETLDFGVGYLGVAEDLTFKVKNTGGGVLTGNISETCSHYSIMAGWGPFSLAGGDSLIVTMRFLPTEEGTHTCTVETGQAICSDVFLTGTVGPEPLIASIADVANDQGRYARINFVRSARDITGSSTPVIQYEAFRRIDQLPVSLPAPGGAMMSVADILLTGWEFAGAIPAHGEDEYNMIVPTLADSTISGGMHWSVFLIRAATSEPLVFFDSPADSGYSLDNLAPGAPDGFSLAYNTGSGNLLSWNQSGAEDFDFFRIYRSTDPGFVPSTGNFVEATVDPGYLDTIEDGYLYSYKITAVDFSGNESDWSVPTDITRAEEIPVCKVFELHQNVPNPFNPSSVIRYDVPAGGGDVRIRIFDVTGRLVRTLVDGWQSPGRRSVAWDGRDSGGGIVASGVYFYRMEAPGFERTRKMVLLR
jgi:hypothetical protein